MAFPTSNKGNLTHNFATEQIIAPQFGGYSPARQKAALAEMSPKVFWACCQYRSPFGEEHCSDNPYYSNGEV
jgi:hypothetical protein